MTTANRRKCWQRELWGGGRFPSYLLLASVLMGVAGLADLASAGPGPQVSVTPSNIVWTSNTWVTLTVSNLAAGAKVNLELYLDVSDNGMVDAALDPLIAAFGVQDGGTNALGSSVIVDDEDGAINGTVVSRIAHFGQEGLFHVVGKYLWLARTVSGGISTTARFSLTQPTSTVWVTGSVIANATSNPVPAAAAFLDCFFDAATPTVWTDTNGAFKLYLPAGVSTANVQSVTTLGLGYFNPLTDRTGTIPFSSFVLTNDLHPGQNVLPIALRVQPPKPGEVFGVSGHVYDDQTNAVPGVMVFVSYHGKSDDPAITDTDGLYRVSVPADNGISEIYVDPSSLMRLGLVAVDRNVAVTNDMTGVDLYCPRATILARGKVLTADTAVPVVGAGVSFDGDAFGSFGVSLTDGTYEVALIACADYSASVDSMNELGLVDAPSIDGLSITNMGEVFTNVSFALPRGYIVSGHVYGPGTEELTGGSVGLFTDFVHAYWDDNSGVDRDGYYQFLAAPGIYGVGAGDFDGYIPQNYANHFRWEGDENGVKCDHVILTTNGLTGLDFHLPRAGTISGHVYTGDGAPLANMDVEVEYYTNTMGYWLGGCGGTTAADGGYRLVVPEGIYRVAVLPPPPYVESYYEDTFSKDASTPIAVSGTNDIPGVDFHLVAHGVISGHVYEEDGVTPLANCPVHAEEFESGSGGVGHTTDSSGYYFVMVWTGRTYRVNVAPSENGLPYLDEWYSNTLDRASAAAVEVPALNEVGDIDFILSPQSYIEGQVTDKNTGLPIAGMSVYADFVPDPNHIWDNWVYYGCPPTDSNGHYSVAVPPGSNYIIQTDSGNSFYPFRCWSNQVDRELATLVAVGPASTVSNISFEIEAGGRITGHIYGDDGTTPLGNCDVYASDYMTGQWVNGRRTDSSGYYSMVVPAAGLFESLYRVAATPQNNNLPYADVFYNDATAWNAAQPVAATVLNETGGIDFRLMLGNLSYDSWKAHYFTTTELADPTISGDDADWDHDGANNLAEYVADTNPRKGDSVLRITGHARIGGGARIEWKGGRWARQYIQRCEDLNAAGDDWTDVRTNDILPTMVTNFVLDTDGTYPASFYRIKADR